MIITMTDSQNNYYFCANVKTSIKRTINIRFASLDYYLDMFFYLNYIKSRYKCSTFSFCLEFYDLFFLDEKQECVLVKTVEDLFLHLLLIAFSQFLS